MRPIDADYLRQLLKERTQFVKEEGHPMWAGAFGVAMSFLNKCPTIDAVPVVRCRDCKHWEKGDFMGGDTPDSLEYGGGCPLVRFARYESDFCSKGERKDGDGNG